MITVTQPRHQKPNRRPGAIPDVPLVTPAHRSRYNTALAAAAALEGLFPLTPAEYAEAAGVAAIFDASPLWTA